MFCSILPSEADKKVTKGIVGYNYMHEQDTYLEQYLLLAAVKLNILIDRADRSKFLVKSWIQRKLNI